MNLTLWSDWPLMYSLSVYDACCFHSVGMSDCIDPVWQLVRCIFADFVNFWCVCIYCEAYIIHYEPVFIDRCILTMHKILYVTPHSGSHAFCKVLEFFCKIFRTWRVLEFAGTWTQWCGRGYENILVRMPLVFVISSYSYKTFCYMWQWWTLQYACYCHALVWS